MIRLVESAVKRASVTVLLTLIVAVMGLYAGMTLPQEYLPPIEFPLVAVVTPYPLASPQVVEQAVTRPLEEAMAGLEGLERIDSTSAENVSFILVNFKLGTDLARAEQQVTSLVNQVRTRLPADVVAPSVSTFGFADLPVLVVSLGANLDQRELKQAIETKIAPALRKVPGVAQVTVTGGGEQEVVIKVDPAKMAALGVTSSTISNALRARGLVLPVGSLLVNGQQVPVKVGDSLANLNELEAMVLTVAFPAAGGAGGMPATAPAPQVVRLRDVATVTLAPAEAASFTRINGKTAVGLQVSKAQGANTVAVAKGVREVLDRSAATVGFDLERTVLFDQSTDITNSLSALNKDGLLGGVLAILVILLFLGNWRSAVVAAFAIPISILAALALLKTQGISLNIFSIGGLAIAVGRLVDDSIVIIEIIYRKFLEGRPIRQAVIEGPREVAGAVAISTLTSVAVFLPLGFVGGIIAEFFRPLAFAVTFALLASLVVALTVIPLLTGLFLRNVTPKQVGREAADAYDFFGRAYKPSMEFALRHRWLVYAGSFALLAGSIFLATKLPTNLFGSQEQSNFNIALDMPAGTPLERTDREVQRLEAILRETPGVKDFNVTIGGGTAGIGGDTSTITAGTNTARFIVVNERPALTAGVVATLRERIAGLNSPAKIQVSLASGGAPTSAKVELQVVADDPATLARASDELMKRMAGVSLVTNVASTLTDARPEITVKVQEDLALAQGLPAMLVSQAVREQISGQSLGSLKLGDQSLAVRLAPTTAAPESVELLKGLPIRTPAGRTVTLGSVAAIALAEGPVSVRRLNGERVALVTADVIGDDTGAATRAVNQALADLSIPGATWRSAGAQEAQSEAFVDLGLAILASIFLVYLFMVIGLRSLATPFILLGAIPLAAIGSFGLMYVTNTALGVPAMLGLLILVGIVVTNGIVLVDLIEQYREQGMSLRQAVIDGGSRRVRPVLMTALTTIVGLMPLAFSESQGGASFISRPLAIASIGGLISATALTLIVIPVAYFSWNSLIGRFRSKPGQPVAQVAD